MGVLSREGPGLGVGVRDALLDDVLQDGDVLLQDVGRPRV